MIKKLNKNEYYLLSPCGLGDTMALCGFKDALEKKLDGKVNFIIKKSHEVVLKMYGYDNYIIENFSLNDLEKIKNTKQPQKGKLYIAHPIYTTNKESLNKFTNLNITFLEFYREFLGLNENTEYKYPIYYPELSEDLKKNLEKIAPLNKIILLAPEATSVPKIDVSQWNNLIKELKKQGFVVVLNSIKPNKKLSGAIHIPMTIDDAVALGISCAGIYSTVSGFCNLVFKKQKNMNIYYPNKYFYDLYNFKKTYNDFYIKESICFEPKYTRVLLFGKISIIKIIQKSPTIKLYLLFDILPIFKKSLFFNDSANL